MPEWLIPGSPTPFETGLRGISAAIKEMPDFGAVLGDISAVTAPLPEFGTAAARQTVDNRQIDNSQQFSLNIEQVLNGESGVVQGYHSLRALAA